jgi:His/Glu/Gln/Arg/opine family amino acid ABC transporter permease subunit
MDWLDGLSHWASIAAGYLPVNLPLVVENAGLFARGVLNTILLLAGSLSAAALIALPLSIVRAWRLPVLNPIVFAYVYLFRGTPMLVQLYLLYYGAAQFDFIRHSFLWPMLRDAWWCAFITFAICSAAYLTEILRGAIESVPRGEVEAAKAMGMSSVVALYRIILPNALRRALPAYSNEVIFMLHGTVIASTVTIVDILGAARQFNNKYYLGMDGFIVAGALYMALVYLISRGFRRWESSWLRHLK